MRRTTATVAAGILCGLMMTDGAHSQAKGYSGTWNLQLTDPNGRARVYAGHQLQIQDTGATWGLKSSLVLLGKDERGWEISGSLDGKSCRVDYDPQASNSRIGPMSCTLYREGDNVIMELNRDVARTTQRFTHALSGDGQTLTVEYEYIERPGTGPRHVVDTRGTAGREIYKKG